MEGNAFTPGRPVEIVNALSVDVEEHFQVSAFEGAIRRSDWSTLPSRVESNTHRLLDLFDVAGVKATFFVLGWIGERKPALVRQISERGHEVASHGYGHRLVYQQTPEDFKAETIASKRLLEDAAGVKVKGYRAASFSITRRSLWALDILCEIGFEYDSSIFPVVHDRYGIPGAPRRPFSVRPAGGGEIIEFPPSTVKLGRLVVPAAGGGYLRVYPLWATRMAIRRLNGPDRSPAMLYVHPWEVDPGQPRIKAPLLTSLRHYTGLRSTEKKLLHLMRRFRFAPVAQAVAAHGQLEAVDLSLLSEPQGDGRSGYLA